jgi:hypothetical protein
MAWGPVHSGERQARVLLGLSRAPAGIAQGAQEHSPPGRADYITPTKLPKGSFVVLRLGREKREAHPSMRPCARLRRQAAAPCPPTRACTSQLFSRPRDGASPGRAITGCSPDVYLRAVDALST